MPEFLHTEVLPFLKLDARELLLPTLKLPNLILLAALYMSLPSIVNLLQNTKKLKKPQICAKNCDQEAKTFKGVVL
jgi:hypothetical protein